MTTFHKVLIANRGEIALRIIQAAKNSGFQTVAIYSEADRNSSFVTTADEAIFVGPSPVDQSYMNCEKVIAAARTAGATMVHPGYGFLSENGDFARACEAAGLVFVGPPADVIDDMGSKSAAKRVALAAGVPCIPGYEGDKQDLDRFSEEAAKIGYPVILKASYGGGGRGIRLVPDEQALEPQFNSASSEAQASFGSGELILEKALINARHIEVQIFADQQGSVVHLGERDCSVQRRHQKVLEESPSPFMTDELRQSMGEAACELANSCRYVGAGTVEFLVDDSSNFYFLEMNTRLQVEHPVTELVTGVDLVKWQLMVACGHPLPLAQHDISLTGHAIEVRLYAEDPANNFMPQTGTVRCWQPATLEGLRIDHAIADGLEVSAHYDPMLAKLIAWGECREDALRRLYMALGDTVLLGLQSNKAYAMALLQEPGFARGDYNTGMIAAIEPAGDDDSELSEEAHAAAIAAIIIHQKSNDQCHRPSITIEPEHYILKSNRHTHSISFTASADEKLPSYCFQIDDTSYEILLESFGHRCCSVVLEGVRRTIPFVESQESTALEYRHQHFSFDNISYQGQGCPVTEFDGALVAQMSGVVVDILSQPGDTVAPHQSIIVMEAMKMEHQLVASIDGVIEQINVEVGDTVTENQTLAVVSAAG